MRLDWVKQQLLRRGAAATARRRNNTSATSSKFNTYIIAESMEPTGCSCVIVTPQKKFGQLAVSGAPSTDVNRESRQENQDSSPPSSSTLRRHRVILPGITPGTVLRTRASVAEWMRTTRQLPAREQFAILLRDGRRVSAQQSTQAALPLLPCPAAAAQTCVRCPWMAQQERQQAKSAKQKAWRTSLLGAVRNCWTAALIAKRNDERSSGDTKADAVSSEEDHTRVIRCFSFLEPLSISVQPNRLQGLQLLVRHKPSTQMTENMMSSPRYTEEGGLSTDDIYAKALRDDEKRSLIELVREGTASTDSSDAARHAQPFRQAGDACLLETLEQKRLVAFLQRWAAQLPTSMQTHLQGVLISQPAASRAVSPSTSTSQPTAQHNPVTSSLQVVLVVRRSEDVLGVQSPLCGSAHPTDLLSTEEQQLVDVVTAAAPLLTDVEVLVCIRDTTLSEVGAGDTVSSGYVHVLYPRLNREASFEDLSLTQWAGMQGNTKSTAAESVQTRRQTQWSRSTVRCWCEPLQRELHVSLSPYHAAVSAAADAWASRKADDGIRHAGRGDAQQPHGSRRTLISSIDSEITSLPWVPTFWRHPSALDLCCSVMMSMLLEEMTKSSANGSTDDPKHHSATPDTVTSRNNDKQVSLRKVGSELLPNTTSPAQLGAIAGQRVLDQALLVLLEEVKCELVHAGPSQLKESSSTRSVNQKLPSELLLYSVHEHARDSSEFRKAQTLCSTQLSQPVRLCLYSCTSTMQTHALGELVASLVQQATSHGNEARVRSGVIDVDPLSSSFVAYALMDLKPRFEVE